MREYFYEVAYILKPSLSQNEVEEEIKKINERIEKYGGKIIDIEKWGKRKLAYKIDKKYDMGYYIFTYVYTNDRDFVKNMENYFKINENVIRFLVFKQKYKFQKDKLKEKMAKKEG